MKSLKIALLTSEYVSEQGAGGIGTYIFHLAQGLSGLGHEPHVITISDHPPGVHEEAGVHVHRVGLALPDGLMMQKFLPASWWSLTRTLATSTYLAELSRDINFDVMDVSDTAAEGLWNSIAGALPMCVRLQTPLLLFAERGFHGIEMNFDYGVLAAMERMAISRADALIAASYYLRDFVASRCELAADGISLMRNPICIDDLQSRSDFAPRGHSTVFLYAGRLEKLKGVHVLAEALALAAKEEPNLKVILIGSDTSRGTDGGSVREELEAILERSGVRQLVEFRDRVPNADLVSSYSEADVAVVPSLYDNAPYACVEAMAAAMPVIGTTEGGMPEYLGNGQRGLVVASGNPQELAQAMLQLHRSEQLRQTLGIAARAYVESECNHIEVARQSLELYHSAMAKYPRGKAVHSALSRTLGEARQAIQLLETLFETLGPAAQERIGYDLGYAAGLRDGQVDGYQRGQRDAIYSNPMVTAIFRLRNLLIRTS